MATEGIRTPNVPLGTFLGEFLGHEIVGSQRSIKRFSRASVMGVYDAALGGSGVAAVFATKVQADAKLTYNADQMAWIVADPDPAKNGIYRKLGASGSGSWSRVADLPNEVIAIDVTGGTANAITGAVFPQTPSSPQNKLYLMTPEAANTGATTLEIPGFAGGGAVPIKNAFGSTLAADSLLPGSQVLMAWQTDHFQLLISAPVDASGILGDVIAARDAASGYADDASDSAANSASYASVIGNQAYTFDTWSQVLAATIPAPITYIRTIEYATGRQGGSTLRRVSSLLSGTIGGQSADGAWWQLVDLIVYPQMAGAPADASGDARAGIQAAVDHVKAIGLGEVRLDGRYILSASINISGRTRIRGTQKTYTIVYPAAGITSFSVNTDESIFLEDFSIQYGTPGTGISVTAPNVNSGSIFRNLFITNCQVALNFTRAAFWIVDHCTIACTQLGVKIQNTHNVDEGDSTIRDCLITGVAGTTMAIQWLSSGGLKVINNKFIDHQYGFFCQLTATAGDIGITSTTGLYFANNSVEGIVGGACYHFERAPGSTGALFSVTISGGDAGAASLINVPVDAVGVWLNGLSVIGVTWISPGTGTSVMLNLNSLTGFYCVGNQAIANGGTVYKAIIGSTAVNGEIGPNPGVGTFAASSNASGSTTLTRS